MQFLKTNTGVIQNDQIYYTYFANEKLVKQGYSHFELCVTGSYLKVGGKEYCDRCNSNGVCEGGYIPMYPKPKYWRETKEEYNFVHCIKSENECLGNDTCKAGYTGLLCENCDAINGYAPSGGGCQKCASQFSVILNVIGLFLFSVVILGNQIYGVKKRISKRLTQKCINIIFDFPVGNVSQLAGIMKIFIMHCQVTYLVATFSLEFPFEVTNFIQILGNPAKMFSISMNCLVNVKSEEDRRKIGYFISFYGLLLTIGTIIFIIMMEGIIYFSSRLIEQKQQLFAYIKCSLLCFFLTIQPGVLQNSLQFLTCRKVNNKLYSTADTNIDCTSSFFKSDVIPINLSLVIFLGFIIPIGIGVMLIRGKRQGIFNRIDFQRKYGILFMEHKDEKYYWEIISILTKILIVIISIVYEQKVIMKGSLVCVTLIGYSFLCFLKWPFITRNLNVLSLYASLTQTITIVLIMCVYELEGERNFFVIIAILVIIGLNGVFGVYSVYLIGKDFIIPIRTILLQYLRWECCGLKKLIIKDSAQEKQAKIRWRKIKIAIHNTNILKRDGITFRNTFQENLMAKLKEQLSMVPINGSMFNEKSIYEVSPILINNNEELITPQKEKVKIHVNDKQNVDMKNSKNGKQSILLNSANKIHLEVYDQTYGGSNQKLTSSQDILGKNNRQKDLNSSYHTAILFSQELNTNTKGNGSSGGQSHLDSPLNVSTDQVIETSSPYKENNKNRPKLGNSNKNLSSSAQIRKNSNFSKYAAETTTSDKNMWIHGVTPNNNIINQSSNFDDVSKRDLLGNNESKIYGSNLINSGINIHNCSLLGQEGGPNDSVIHTTDRNFELPQMNIRKNSANPSMGQSSIESSPCNLGSPNFKQSAVRSQRNVSKWNNTSQIITASHIGDDTDQIQFSDRDQDDKQKDSNCIPEQQQNEEDDEQQNTDRVPYEDQAGQMEQIDKNNQIKNYNYNVEVSEENQ